MAANCAISFQVGEIAVRTTSAASSNSSPRTSHTANRNQTSLRRPARLGAAGNCKNRAVESLYRSKGDDECCRRLDSEGDRTSNRLKN